MSELDQGVGVQLPNGTSTSLKWDDVEHMGGAVPDAPRIQVHEKLSEHLHDMPENWLRSRVRGWMELTESVDLDYWLGTYTADGKWIFCSSRQDTFAPLQHRIDYARRVCRHLNKTSAHGGAWLAGWIRGGHEFYLLYKDPDGDIAIPLECDRPFTQLVGWSLFNWEQHAEGAYKVWSEFQRNLEIADGQEKKVAQGEAVSPTHLQEAPAIGI